MKKKNLLMTAIAIFGLATITTAQVPSYVPTNGLVGWWPFNSNANDESGNGNNGVVNGATLTTDRNGVANKAYSFDGVSNSIDLGNPATLGNNPQNYTQTVWAQYQDFPTTSVYNVYPLISKRHQNNGNDWATPYLNPNGQIVFVADDAFYENATPAYSNVLNIGQWYHFTFVKSINNYSIYVNGILINSSTDNHIMEGSTDNILIGAQLAWNQYNKGRLDDIGIWNRALTQQEITDLYNGCQLSVNIQPISQTINLNNNSQFVTGSSDPSATYQWQTDLGVGFQNLNSVGQYSGTTNDTLTVSNITLSNYNQPFRCIISLGSCSDTSNVAVLAVNNNLGINETSHDNLFSVFPNPAQSVINVKADSKLIGSIYTIYENTGKVVLTGKLNSDNTTIDLGNLTGGTYMFSVGENMKQTFKVIKE